MRNTFFEDFVKLLISFLETISPQDIKNLDQSVYSILSNTFFYVRGQIHHTYCPIAIAFDAEVCNTYFKR